jgi:hypothetical protein
MHTAPCSLGTRHQQGSSALIACSLVLRHLHAGPQNQPPGLMYVHVGMVTNAIRASRPPACTLHHAHTYTPPNATRHRQATSHTSSHHRLPPSLSQHGVCNSLRLLEHQAQLALEHIVKSSLQPLLTAMRLDFLYGSASWQQGPNSPGPWRQAKTSQLDTAHQHHTYKAAG